MRHVLYLTIGSLALLPFAGYAALLSWAATNVDPAWALAGLLGPFGLLVVWAMGYLITEAASSYRRGDG